MSSDKVSAPTPNKGMAWTPDEFSLLLTGLREKKTLAEVAEAHGRTVNSIKFKALGYACDEILNGGQAMDKVVEDLGLSQSEVEKELNKRKNLPKVNPVAPVKKVLVVKKVKATSATSSVDELTELMTSVNRLQSLVQRYVNKVRSNANSK